MERTEDEVKSILVADDESDVRMVLRALLAGSGYAVTEAADGQEALDMMAEGKFDLLILDLMMPGTGEAARTSDNRPYCQEPAEGCTEGLREGRVVLRRQAIQQRNDS
jgi:CheY-like chemotaxis protein